MKYFLLEKIQNIINFEVQENQILLVTNENKLILNNKIIYDKNLQSFVRNLNGNIVFSNLENQIYSYNDELKLLIENYSLNEKKHNDDKIYISKRISRGIYETHLFSLVNNENVLIDQMPWYVKNSTYIFCNLSVVKKNTTLSSEGHQWETNLESWGEVRKILGLNDNKLWISMYRGGNDNNKNTIIALDALSGQIVYQSPVQYDISDWFVELVPKHNSILSIYGKISTIPAASPIVEINAATGEIIRNQKIESLYNENLKIGFWKVLKDKIYFTANKDALNGNHIGVLDYNTLQILWVTKIDNMKGTFKDLQITENKIYALDTANQLHVYEKE